MPRRPSPMPCPSVIVSTAPEAVLDTGREKRLGFPEAIYAAGKTPIQTKRIFAEFLKTTGSALATRCSPETLALLRQSFPKATLCETGRTAQYRTSPISHDRFHGRRVAILAAGTSDLPVAEEAAATLTFAGVALDRCFDIGVAGLHRLLERLPLIRQADVVIVTAGMEGALPSVVGGLVSAPLIAVPTSVGYGANFGGLSALLGMLNSCSAGITVVNIDNGFGAAVAAIRILSPKTT